MPILVLLLLGCRSTPTIALYFYGTLVGYHLTNAHADRNGAPVEVRLLEVGQKRYSFEGTAVLGGDAYTIGGYEETDSEVGFLSPQAAPRSGEGSLPRSPMPAEHPSTSSAARAPKNPASGIQDLTPTRSTVAPSTCNAEHPFATV